MRHGLREAKRTFVNLADRNLERRCYPALKRVADSQIAACRGVRGPRTTLPQAQAPQRL